MDIAKQLPRTLRETSSLNELGNSIYDQSLVVDLIESATQRLKKKHTNVNEHDKVILDDSKTREIWDLVSPAIKPRHRIDSLQKLSTGVPSLDEMLLGGFSKGQVHEVCGASGVGKSQLLLQCALNATTKELEFNKNTCIFITTESCLETRRMLDMKLDEIHYLDNISYIYCHDTETQDHIIFTQLEAKIHKEKEKGHNLQAIIIDSISHHLRPNEEYLNTLFYLRSYLDQQEDRLNKELGILPNESRGKGHDYEFMRGKMAYVKRISKRYYLYNIYRHLSFLSRMHGVTVLLANQVSDFIHEDSNTDMDAISHEPLRYDIQLCSLMRVERSIGDCASNPNFDEFSQTTSSHTEVATDSGRSSRVMGKADEVKRFNRLLTVMPALGYSWSKFIETRIMLQKEYQSADTTPRNNLRDLLILQDVSSEPTKLSSRSKRFAQVITSRIGRTNQRVSCTVGFAITLSGIVENSHARYN